MILKQVRAITVIALLACGTVLSSPVFAANEAMMELLKVLHENGTIDDATYGLLKNSAAADAERTDAKIEETAEQKLASVNKISDKLKWAERIKLKGDLRLRWENEENDPEVGETTNRERYRYRLRVGADAEVNDKVKVGVGIASGGRGSNDANDSGNARSTNQNFDGNFGTKSLDLDYAYAQWKATDNITVIGGKFKRKPFLWTPTDMLWDSDINPEGVSAHGELKNSLGTTYANFGYWILDEFDSASASGDSDDVNLTYFQIGQKFKSGNFFGNVAGIYYNFDNLSDATGGTNGISFGTTTVNDLDSFGLSAEVGMKDFLIAGKQVSVFADYVNNDESGVDEDTGIAIGFKFGDKKVKQRHQWQIKYVNVDLEQDAFLASYPDSDRFGGSTGVKAHEIALKYGLAKNVYLGLDYYDSEIDAPGLDDDEQELLQIDLVTKF